VRKKKMKKENMPIIKNISIVLASILCVMCLFGLAGCQGGSSEQKSQTGVTNPIQIVDSAETFEEQLEIEIDASKLDKKAIYAIIGGKVAQITYDIQEQGLPVTAEITIRGTKDAQTAENLSGIYDESMKDLGDKSVNGTTVKAKESPETGSWIYAWETKNTFWEMCYHGSMDETVLETHLVAAVTATKG